MAAKMSDVRRARYRDLLKAVLDAHDDATVLANDAGEVVRRELMSEAREQLFKAIVSLTFILHRDSMLGGD